VAALIFLALMVVAFWFLIIRPQRKQLAEHRQLVSSLDVGDEVVTNSGIYGRIEEMDEATVDLEIAEDVIVRMARTAIAQRLTDELDTEDEAAEQTLEADDVEDRVE